MVEWYEPDSWVTKLFGAHLSTFIITVLVAFGAPLLLHMYIYRQRAPASLPNFVLLGPSAAGKTALLTTLETGQPRDTHPTQAVHKATLTLPQDYTPFSARYRSVNDPSAVKGRQAYLTDTPGHGKLRSAATATMASAANLRGLVFVVDAAALASPAALSQAAEFLHDVLLALQRRYTSAKTSRGPKACPVLVAANKSDLFTALPAQLVRAQLEAEITKVRSARAKGILDVGVGEDADAAAPDAEWLGDGGEGKFEFRQMEEVNVVVDVVAGSVTGEEGPGVGAWWEWIAGQM
ncbi:uncharacterized protein K452DRAFT_316345 [Aplosporella prunicola CBS 121167]|uniref:Signal recognition particle receptor subunit beta n=1 Tax=Aplosporella prunicola CBS 121167 TaxID=1176127 RepID=A0A6A6BMA8_9PEZI|nr:uncharacterized protein K452DRAFT_316345 [Aplosporella prunicola CBS 121167]KAF2145270.1 hypothetical protein K452DRAFT_316345 [Aplosporella prunicola CBS 121167]